MEREQLVKLVTEAQRGDTQSMNLLFNEFYNDVYYFALKTVKNEDIACDVTQETFVEIIKTINNLQEPAAFVTWMKQITYHQCTRYFKKKKDVLVEEDEDGNTIFDSLKEERTEFIPDKALEQKEFKETILAMIDSLSEEQRSAIMMYYFDELSVKEIAEIQGVSEGTVKSRLNYGRKAIKNSVEEYEKKNGIKLHAIPFFPFFKWLFEGSFDNTMATASAEAVAAEVASATGVTISVTASTGAVATTTVATAATGLWAKITALPLVSKIIAGVLAVTVAVGGTTAVVSNVNNNSNSLTEEEKTAQVQEMARGYTFYENIDGFLPYFNSPSELSARDAGMFIYAKHLWWGDSYEKNDLGNGYVVFTIPVSDFELWSQRRFGQTYDFKQLDGENCDWLVGSLGEFEYDAEKEVFYVTCPTGGGGDAEEPPECTVEKTGDNTYVATVTRNETSIEVPSSPLIDYEVEWNEEDGTRTFKYTRINVITFTYVDGYWRIDSHKLLDTNTEDDKLRKAEYFAKYAMYSIHYTMPYFNNPSEIPDRLASIFIYHQGGVTIEGEKTYMEIEDDAIGEAWYGYIPLSKFENASQRLLGHSYDYKTIDGHNAGIGPFCDEILTYDSAKNAIKLTYIEHFGGGGDGVQQPECSAEKIGENKYVVTMTQNMYTTEAPAMDIPYETETNEYGTYYKYTKIEKLTLTYNEGYWQVNSFVGVAY